MMRTTQLEGSHLERYGVEPDDCWHMPMVEFVPTKKIKTWWTEDYEHLRMTVNREDGKHLVHPVGEPSNIVGTVEFTSEGMVVLWEAND